MSILIKDTTPMERIRIVKDALDGEYDEFYLPLVVTSTASVKAVPIWTAWVKYVATGPQTNIGISAAVSPGV